MSNIMQMNGIVSRYMIRQYENEKKSHEKSICKILQNE